MSNSDTIPALKTPPPASADAVLPQQRGETRAKLLNWSSFLFALLQSFCSAVVAISGIRVAIGLGALAAAAGVDAPARGFHADRIRIPMMALALAGALLNLYFLWHLRRLRNRDSARWRRKPISQQKRNSERLQFALSIA